MVMSAPQDAVLTSKPYSVWIPDRVWPTAVDTHKELPHKFTRRSLTN